MNKISDEDLKIAAKQFVSNNPAKYANSDLNFAKSIGMERGFIEGAKYILSQEQPVNKNNMEKLDLRGNSDTGINCPKCGKFWNLSKHSFCECGNTFSENKTVPVEQPVLVQEGKKQVKELQAVMDFDGRLNTCVHRYPDDTYRELQQLWFKAIDAIQCLL